MDIISLRPLTKLGKIWGHFYLDKNGTEHFQECTQAEYEALVSQGKGKPNVPGVWTDSGCFDRFDTVSGLVEEGTYYDDGNRQYVRANGIDAVLLSGTIVNNQVSFSELITLDGNLNL